MQSVFQGRETREASIHLTLVFVGAVAEEKLPCLLAPPANLFTSNFRFTLDTWGCWVRNGIGWAAPSHVPAPLCELVANLDDWLRGAGFEPEDRAFSPHVTLVRKAHCAPMPDAMTPIEWSVEEFALIRSRLTPGGSRYEILVSWPLR